MMSLVWKNSFESVKFDFIFHFVNQIIIFFRKQKRGCMGARTVIDYFIAEKRVNSHLFPNLSIKKPAPITTKAFL